ncbi:MAG TPA: glycosyltransferase family 4 protein [Candidatus Acidoferrum sp.]
MTAPIKVCVLTSAHPAFDVRVFHKECKSLARAGYDVTLVAPHGESLTVDGVTVKAVAPARWRFERWFKTTAAVYRAAVAVDAEIYHFHDPELIPVGLLLRALGKKVIYDVHEDLPLTVSYKPYIPKWMQRPLSSLLAIMESLTVRQFSGLIAATPEIAARFAGHPNVCVVQNYPMREEFPEEFPGEMKTVHGDYIVYVGLRITRARGAEEMVRAMELLPGNIPIRLKLAGTIEPPDLQQRLEAMPGWQSTEYLGALGRAGVSKLIQNAMVGLVVLHPEPNYVSSHPVKLFEYMCAGIPVIASDFPGFRAIIEQAKCGILVDPFSAKEVADAIEFLYTHPEEAPAMGARGRLAVSSRYNWQHEEQSLLGMYNRLRHVAESYEQFRSELT